MYNSKRKRKQENITIRRVLVASVAVRSASQNRTVTTSFRHAHEAILPN